ncbi:hypothetical protein T265_05442 [Opisthorchis viverrini]|uniref:Uncharacterized protein n=1 Tax=Opisthorchis viverrini TaxID=6198 RepID=A0A074ZW13_OPIVI|nr:hypothetical protein T265_05442 [Opisthorchis viverrini]KER27555.1 hypothetical protein T265_05442 [Opisthorchis viverrini]
MLIETSSLKILNLSRIREDQHKRRSSKLSRKSPGRKLGSDHNLRRESPDRATTMVNKHLRDHLMHSMLELAHQPHLIPSFNHICVSHKRQIQLEFQYLSFEDRWRTEKLVVPVEIERVPFAPKLVGSVKEPGKWEQAAVVDEVGVPRRCLQKPNGPQVWVVERSGSGQCWFPATLLQQA